MLIKGLGPSPEKVTLRIALDRLLADGVRTPEALIERVASTPAPLLEVYETEDTLMVKAHLPGVAPEELHVDVSEQTLTISGETGANGLRDAGDRVMEVQVYGAFERTVPLPCAVRTDQAMAEFVDGILTLTLPKAEPMPGQQTEI
jgi:HSP20 family protein